jgi:hypothetical protein
MESALGAIDSYAVSIRSFTSEDCAMGHFFHPIDEDLLLGLRLCSGQGDIFLAMQSLRAGSTA